MLEPTEINATLLCAQCSHRAVWPFQLNLHIQKNHLNISATEPFHAELEPELYSCVHCEFKNNYRLGLYEHFKTQHNANSVENNKNRSFYEEPRQYSCDCCKCDSHSVLSFIKHSRKHVFKAKARTRQNAKNQKLAQELPSLVIVTENGDLRCANCPYKATTRRNLRHHRIVAHAKADEIQWWHCTKCWYRAKLKSYLKSHMLRHAPADEIKWFNCAQCSYRTYRKANMNSHVLAHAESHAFDCPICSHRAKSKRTFDRHKLTHARPEEITWFNCTECSYRCTARNRVKRHALRHVKCEKEVERLQCTECSFQAGNKRSLKQRATEHVKTAGSLAKRHSCSKCPFQSKYRPSLNTHMRIHATGDEAVWFNCSECSYRARQKAHLKKHVVSKHTPDEEVSWFYCGQCSYRAKQKATLKDHMLTHAKDEDIEWFRCAKCPYRAKHRINLRLHSLNKHAAQLGVA